MSGKVFFDTNIVVHLFLPKLLRGELTAMASKSLAPLT